MNGRKERKADYAIVWPLQAPLGEGPMWDARTGRLYFVDIIPGRLHAYEPATGARRTWEVGRMLSAVVPRTAGGLAVVVREGFATYDPDQSRLDFLTTPAGHDPSRVRFNDGKCDPAGRFWAGTMGLKAEPGAGALYCLPPGGPAQWKVGDVTISNGLAWRDRRLYYIDSITRLVRAFDYEPATGAISRPVTALVLPPGDDVPDGCSLDAEGMLWIAHWGAGKVSRWDPVRGRCLQEYRFPASQITSCAFGGPGLKTLYVTSAREGLAPEQLAREPEAGALFAFEPGPVGLEPDAFAG
ncbi:MAG: SMP-30/gluconolactonase/LRE family protein [Opitutaceae bacterium]|nr:SMP-30/gluconolactonase/LRE family protein [Opitutaceae bacterium]